MRRAYRRYKERVSKYMAKECINCGAEIKFYQDYFCLMNQGVYFCGTCAQKAKPLLQDIKIALSDASYQSAKKKFDEELPQSGPAATRSIRRARPFQAATL